MERLTGWLLLALAAPAAAAPPGENTTRKTVDVAGVPRTFLLHVPPRLPKNTPVPLLFMFHGGGGDGAGAERLTKFSTLADREFILVAYPDGTGGNFNDGRESVVSTAHETNVDDVAFVAAMIESANRVHPVDARRIYATGLSNGGIFCHYLAAKLSDRIAAVAPVAGGMAERLATDFKPSSPVSVFIIQGMNDPLVPYQGGPLVGGRRGTIVDTDQAAQLWATHNACQSQPKLGELPDEALRDGCQVKWAKWTGGQNGSEVWLYRVEGGGHTWPGGPQFLPADKVGAVCYDFKATEAVWAFFKGHAKP